MSNCLACHEVLNNRQKRFCSNQCQQDYQYVCWIKNWKEGKEKGTRGKILLTSYHIRKYLFNKNENKCQRCGWGEVNPISEKIPLEVNHIDGDASNCKEENLELICPNCHSLTPNFRNLNKSSKRQR